MRDSIVGEIEGAAAGVRKSITDPTATAARRPRPPRCRRRSSGPGPPGVSRRASARICDVREPLGDAVCHVVGHVRRRGGVGAQLGEVAPNPVERRHGPLGRGVLAGLAPDAGSGFVVEQASLQIGEESAA